MLEKLVFAFYNRIAFHIKLLVIVFFVFNVSFIPFLYAEESENSSELTELSSDSSEEEKEGEKEEPPDNRSKEAEKLAQEVDKLQMEVKKLQLEQSIRELAHQESLLTLQQKKEKLILEKELISEQAQRELAELTAQKDKLLIENEVQAAKETQEASKLNTTKTRLELENAIKEAQQKQVQAEMQAELDKATLTNALQQERNKQTQLKIELETAKMSFEVAKIELTKAKQSLSLEDLNRKIAERDSQEAWRSQVNELPKYLKEPFVEGRLIISDRRIQLEEIIWDGAGDRVVERIHYFNNKSSEYPIFLIITRCYGGSVMEGAKILKAMEESQAPIYVVVESFAASMAAILTTLADRSYALPNAMILHHQVWGVFWGNSTEVKEQVEIVEEWSKRILKPVAQKMGITLEDFTKQMYENNANGNWMEFADTASKLKWVDSIVGHIRDTSVIKQPVQEEASSPVIEQFEKVDEKGQRYLKLPRLSPPDFYYLYNPDSYYR
jgi:ATP-dependent Clp protease protease subunit